MKDIKVEQQQKLWYLQIADLHTFTELNILWLDILRPTSPHSWRKKINIPRSLRVFISRKEGLF